MSFIATAIAGSAVIGAGASIYASGKQVSAEQAATQEQQNMFNYGASQEQPFVQAGQAALPTLQSLLTPGPNQTQTLSQLPGYEFLQDWGQKGVSAQATTRGLGGNALAAGAQFGVGTAQQGFSTIINALQGLVNTGQGAAAGVLGGANQAGANIAGTTVGAGNAAAGGATGVAGSLVGGAQSATNLAILNSLTGGNLFKGMYGTNSGTPGGTTVAPTSGYVSDSAIQ